MPNKNEPANLFVDWQQRYDTTEANYWGASVVKQGLSLYEQKLISKYFTLRSNILNVGCGGGREAFILAKNGYQITAIDLSHKMIEMAIENSKKLGIRNIDFKIANVCDLPFIDKTFNNILATANLLNHIPKHFNRIQALKEMKRVLKNGGYLIAVSNSINGKIIYQAYFKITNFIKKFYNPHQCEQNDTKPFKTGNRYRLIRKGPVFHWYSALEFLDDLCQAGFKVIDFLSAKEIENNQRNLAWREKGGPICYVAQK